MKKFYVMLFFIVAATVSLRAGDFGLGIVLGDPTGISFKVWTSKTTAIDGGFAWSFGKYDAVHLHADYLFHSMNLAQITSNNWLYMHYGIGGRFIAAGKDDKVVADDENDTKARIGVRIPIGVDYRLKTTPIDFFIEIAPVFDLVPETELSFNAGIGVRYYF